MRISNSGFTLIALVVAVSVIAIVITTALPRYLSMPPESMVAAVKGFANAVTNGNKINYSAYMIKRAVIDGSEQTPGVVNTSKGCSVDVANALIQDPLPANNLVYDVTTPPVPVPIGNSVECKVQVGGDDGPSATFTITGAK